MDWRSVKFDWNRARAFLVTAEEGSLSAAARALNMTQPTLGRQVTALEQELGVVLFERAGRGLELTPSGLELVEHVRAMGDAANRLSLTASGQSDSIEGNVCITATEEMSTFVLPRLIKKLRQKAPGIEIELIASNSTSDLGRREADIAIRGFRPTQSSLITRRLSASSFNLYATKDYLQQLGYPGSLDELNKADFIGFATTDELLNALNSRGLKLSSQNFPVITDNRIVQWELVKQGLGIGLVPDELAATEPLVEQVLPDLELFVGELWLVAHRELRTNRRVRMVFDFLVDALSTGRFKSKPSKV